MFLKSETDETTDQASCATGSFSTFPFACWARARGLPGAMQFTRQLTRQFTTKVTPEGAEEKPRSSGPSFGALGLMAARGSAWASRARAKLRKPIRQQLSLAGQLSKAKRDTKVEADQIAEELAAAKKLKETTQETHERLVTEHDASQLELATRLVRDAAKPLSTDNRCSAVHGLRQLGTPPPKTALVVKCAAVLLDTVQQLKAEKAAAEAAAAAPAPAGTASSSGGSVAPKKPRPSGPPKMPTWEDALSVLTRSDYRTFEASIRQFDLLLLMTSAPEIAALVGTQADFGSACPGAAQAKEIVDLATFGKRKGVALLKRKAKAVAMATTAVKSDKDKKDKYKPSDGVPAAGGTTRAGSSRLERQATVEVNLDKLIEEEVAAQMTLEDAAGSTSETGHLFTWVAQILGAACKLHAKEQVARPAITDAASKADMATKDVKRLEKLSKAATKAAAEASLAHERHKAQERLEEQKKATEEAQALKQAQEQQQQQVAAPPAAAPELPRWARSPVPPNE